MALKIDLANEFHSSFFWGPAHVSPLERSDVYNTQKRVCEGFFFLV